MTIVHTDIEDINSTYETCQVLLFNAGVLLLSRALLPSR
jgi:hypothetical protein